MRDHPPPPPWQAADIGAVGVTGRAFVEDGTLILNGAGAGIGGSDDACYFVSQWMVAAGEIVVRVASLENTSPCAQAGVMMDIGPKSDMHGSPAMPAQQARRVYALFTKLPELAERIKTLEEQVQEFSNRREADSKP